MRAHQVTAAALFTLQQLAYKHYRDHLGDARDEQLEFENWCQQQVKTCSQFDYWATVLATTGVDSSGLRTVPAPSILSNVHGCPDRASDMVSRHGPHQLYACWIPVHLQDMVSLATTHPEKAKEFEAGNFTIQKTSRQFAAIPIDQTHEQNNAAIK